MLVGLINKGVFLVNFQGKEESIMQNKSDKMQFESSLSESGNDKDIDIMFVVCVTGF